MKKYANVTFENNHGNQLDQVYVYLVDIENLKCGDYVVVETRGTLSVARFIAYTNRNPLAYTNRNTLDSEITKWVVQKIDMKTHKKRKENYEKLIEIKTKMLERVQELEELDMFERLSDKEMKNILKEYKKIME